MRSNEQNGTSNNLSPTYQLVESSGLVPMVMLNGRAYVLDGYLHLFPGRPDDRISDGRPSDGTSRDLGPNQ
jgi:hypothetical protein